MLEQTNYNTCIICLEDIKYVPCILLCCNSNYHYRCVRRWFNNNDLCPHCRQYINYLPSIQEHSISIQNNTQNNTPTILLRDIIYYYRRSIIICLIFEGILVISIIVYFIIWFYITY